MGVLPADEVKAHLDVLYEVVPGWAVRSVVPGHAAVIRLTGSVTLANVKARLAAALEAARNAAPPSVSNPPPPSA